MLVIKSCLTLCDPVDYIPPGSFLHGIFQARILEWVAISSSRGSSLPKDQTQVSWVSCSFRWILYHWATGKPKFESLRCRAPKAVSKTLDCTSTASRGLVLAAPACVSWGSVVPACLPALVHSWNLHCFAGARKHSCFRRMGWVGVCVASASGKILLHEMKIWLNIRILNDFLK